MVSMRIRTSRICSVLFNSYMVVYQRIYYYMRSMLPGYLLRFLQQRKMFFAIALWVGYLLVYSFWTHYALTAAIQHTKGRISRTQTRDRGPTSLPFGIRITPLSILMSCRATDFLRLRSTLTWCFSWRAVNFWALGKLAWKNTYKGNLKNNFEIML